MNNSSQPTSEHSVILGKNINKFPINHLPRPTPSSLQTHAMKMQQECSREALRTASTKQALSSEFVKLILIKCNSSKSTSCGVYCLMLESFILHEIINKCNQTDRQVKTGRFFIILSVTSQCIGSHEANHQRYTVSDISALNIQFHLF